MTDSKVRVARILSIIDTKTISYTCKRYPLVTITWFWSTKMLAFTHPLHSLKNLTSSNTAPWASTFSNAQSNAPCWAQIKSQKLKETNITKFQKSIKNRFLKNNHQNPMLKSCKGANKRHLRINKDHKIYRTRSVWVDKIQRFTQTRRGS